MKWFPIAARVTAIATGSILLAFVVNEIRPSGSIPVVRPSRAEIILREGIVPTRLDTVMILHRDTSILFVDARPASAFKRGHIPRATSLPSEEFENLFNSFRERVPLTRPLVVYCDGVECPASDEVSHKLKAKGYRFVYWYFEGWAQWRDSAKEIER